MKTIFVDTQCQKCHKPMKVEVTPSPVDKDGNDVVDLKPFLSMATCDDCLVGWGYARRKQNVLPMDVPKPYKDL